MRDHGDYRDIYDHDARVKQLEEHIKEVERALAQRTLQKNLQSDLASDDEIRQRRRRRESDTHRNERRRSRSRSRSRERSRDRSDMDRSVPRRIKEADDRPDRIRSPIREKPKAEKVVSAWDVKDPRKSSKSRDDYDKKYEGSKSRKEKEVDHYHERQVDREKKHNEMSDKPSNSSSGHSSSRKPTESKSPKKKSELTINKISPEKIPKSAATISAPSESDRPSTSKTSLTSYDSRRISYREGVHSEAAKTIYGDIKDKPSSILDASTPMTPMSSQHSSGSAQNGTGSQEKPKIFKPRELSQLEEVMLIRHENFLFEIAVHLQTTVNMTTEPTDDGGSNIVVTFNNIPKHFLSGQCRDSTNESVNLSASYNSLMDALVNLEIVRRVHLQHIQDYPVFNLFLANLLAPICDVIKGDKCKELYRESVKSMAARQKSIKEFQTLVRKESQKNWIKTDKAIMAFLKSQPRDVSAFALDLNLQSRRPPIKTTIINGGPISDSPIPSPSPPPLPKKTPSTTSKKTKRQKEKAKYRVPKYLQEPPPAIQNQMIQQSPGPQTPRGFLTEAVLRPLMMPSINPFGPNVPPPVVQNFSAMPAVQNYSTPSVMDQSDIEAQKFLEKLSRRASIDEKDRRKRSTSRDRRDRERRSTSRDRRDRMRRSTSRDRRDRERRSTSRDRRDRERRSTSRDRRDRERRRSPEKGSRQRDRSRSPRRSRDDRRTPPRRSREERPSGVNGTSTSNRYSVDQMPSTMPPVYQQSHYPTYQQPLQYPPAQAIQYPSQPIQYPHMNMNAAHPSTPIPQQQYAPPQGYSGPPPVYMQSHPGQYGPGQWTQRDPGAMGPPGIGQVLPPFSQPPGPGATGYQEAVPQMHHAPAVQQPANMTEFEQNVFHSRTVSPDIIELERARAEYGESEQPRQTTTLVGPQVSRGGRAVPARKKEEEMLDEYDEMFR